MLRHFFRKRIALITAMALFLCATPFFSEDVFASFEIIIDYDLDVTYGQSDARSMLAMINDFRTGSEAWEYTKDNTKYYHKGLPELTYDYELERIAMQRAAELAIYFDHVRPDGSGYNTAYTEAFMYEAQGENIAMGYDYYPAKDVFTDWKEENETYAGQGHRRNMLLPDYRSVGIGHVIYNGCEYWVQEFSNKIVDTSYVAPNDSATTVTISTLESLITGEPTKGFTCGDYEYIISDKDDALITTCNASGDIVIPEYLDGHKVTALVPELFFDRSGITSVFIPATIDTFDIWGYVFSCCYDLKAINVDKNNPVLKSVDGVLYSRDMKILYNYPTAKEGTSYTVPAVTEALCDESFACVPLKKLIIENPETGWYPNAFLKDYNLEVIYRTGGTSQMLVESGMNYGPAFTNYVPPVKVPGKAVIKSLKPGRKSVKITIKKMSGAKYKIQYRIKGKKKWSTKTLKKTSYTFKNLKSGKKYQFRVRAYKTVNGKTYNGKWSKTKTVKIR